MPASGDPAAVVDEPQRTQCLDELQFVVIEFAKIFVAFDDASELTLHRVTLAREHHPQVLYGRPHAAIVEVDEMRTCVVPQNVTRVAIPVKANRFKFTHTRKNFTHTS